MCYVAPSKRKYELNNNTMWSYTFILMLVVQVLETGAFVNYVVFPGFDSTSRDAGSHTTESAAMAELPVNSSSTYATNNESKLAWFDNVAGVTTPPTSSNTTNTALESTVATPSRPTFICPPERRPQNIGPYEVPTRREVVTRTRALLKKKYDIYLKKSIAFLKDIKDASRATQDVFKNRCFGVEKMLYRGCVKQLHGRWQHVAKAVVNALETRKHQVDAQAEATICNKAPAEDNPLLLLKTVVEEEISNQFALANFLRALSACSNICKTKKEDEQYIFKNYIK